jgi:hypothetical protein
MKTMAFRIGMKVVCINDDFGGIPSRYTVPSQLPKSGRVYTVREIVPRIPGRTKGVQIRLEEIVLPLADFTIDGFRRIEPAFGASRFRPAVERKTDISAFKEILDRENHGLPSRVDYPADCEPK